MFAFQSLILNLFTLLTFMAPHQFGVHEEQNIFRTEESINTAHRQSSAILESTLFLNQVLETSQNSELPFTNPFDSIKQTIAVAYEPKLLYFSIGNAIDIEFNSTKIIFPFHCFT